MQICLTLLFLITLSIFVKGYIERELNNKTYKRSCKVLYLPEKQTMDVDKILIRKKDSFDRNFKNPIQKQFEESEISKKINDKKNENILSSSLLPERGSRTDPYY